MGNIYMLRQRLIERILQQSAHNGSWSGSLLPRGLSEQRGNPLRFLSQLGLTSSRPPAGYRDASRNMGQLLSSSEQHSFEPKTEGYTEEIFASLLMKKGNLHAEPLKFPQGDAPSIILRRPTEYESDSKTSPQRARDIFATGQEQVLSKSPAEAVLAQVSEDERNASNVDLPTANDSDIVNREIETLGLPQHETLITSVSEKRRARIEEASHPITKPEREAVSAKALNLEESSQMQPLEKPASPNSGTTDNTSILEPTPERTPAEWAELLFAVTGEPISRSEHFSEVQQENVPASKPFHELSPAEMARRLFALTEPSSESGDVYNNIKQHSVPPVRSLARPNTTAENAVNEIQSA